MTAARALQRSQEVDDRLLIGRRQRRELADRRAGLRAGARVRQDRPDQAAVARRRPAVVQKKIRLPTPHSGAVRN